MSLNACRSDPSLNHKLSFMRNIFSNSKYITSHEFLPSINIYDMLKWLTVAVMTRRKISFGVPSSFSSSRNLSIGLFRVLAETFLSFYGLPLIP